MWATLRTFEHNKLDGMTLIPAPKYGQTLLPTWAFAFHWVPRMSAPNMPISNYCTGFAERVTTV
jgi:hypothetical protein